MSTRLVALALLSVASTVQAQVCSDAASCEQASCAYQHVVPLVPFDFPPSEAGEVDIEGASIEVIDERRTVVTGAVKLQQGEQRLTADRVAYDPDTGTFSAQGNVRFADPQARFEAAEVTVERKSNRSSAQDVRYDFAGAGGHGEAAGVARLGEQISELQGLSYTTCPGEQPAWQLDAHALSIDHSKDRGTARNVKLRLGGQTVLWLPYAAFPLGNVRQSGWLTPGIGYSEQDGASIAAPYYWNIAPQYDATLTPQVYTERGVMAQAEFRYLGDRYRGQIDASYLPDDDQVDRHRGYARWQHQHRLTSGWTANVDWRHVSDVDYFEDFGGTLEQAAQSLLPSIAQLRYRDVNTGFGVQARAFESLDENLGDGQLPYARLPRLYFQHRNRWQRLAYGFSSDATAFRRDAGLEGERLDAYAWVALPWQTPGSFVRPEIGYRSTHYRLDRDDNDAPQRNLPIYSLDAGLVFERSLELGGSSLLQTLEPRLFYVYAPFEDQSELPVFDTGPLTFGASQLFATNRFAGGDRVGDANRVSLALTTRFLSNDSGRELLRASMGRIRHFDAREVQLPGRAVDDRDYSPWIGEVTWQPARSLLLRAGLQWEPEPIDTASRIPQALFALEHTLPSDLRYRLAYRKREGLVDQVEASTYWPLNSVWSLLAGVNYSLRSDQLLEAVAGVGYENCCLAVRVVGRRYVIDDDEDDFRSGIFVELVLKGLGQIGSGSDHALRRAIVGFDEAGPARDPVILD